MTLTTARSGANVGFSSVFESFVNDKLSIIILTNTDQANPGVIANVHADYYFKIRMLYTRQDSFLYELLCGKIGLHCLITNVMELA